MRGIHILPMRNWNPLSRLSSIGHQGFTSYLWGIETIEQFEGLKEYDEFTSYWKHPAYKGAGGLVWRNMMNSHPTYEELKLIRGKALYKPSFIIHILPMRNWNSVDIWVIDKSREFTSYLWGIETYRELVIKQAELDSHPTYEELKQFPLSA